MIGTIILLSGLMVGMYTFFIALCRTSARAEDREVIAARGPSVDIETLSRRPWMNVCEQEEPRTTAARSSHRKAPIVV
jgi:hypothetical protein